MTTPRSQIRAWVRDAVESGRVAPADVAMVAIDYVLDQDDLVGELIADVVQAEVNRVLFAGKGTKPALVRNAAQLRQEIEEDAKASPFAHVPAPKPKERNILLDVANMTKLEVLNTANTLDGEASQAARYAGLLRAIADRLTGTEKVRDRFTTNDLQALYARSAVKVKAEFFLGDRQVGPTKELAGD
jgi:hypothetical protein